MAQELTEDERWLVNHVSMFGSDGFPVHKVGRQWTWGPVRSVKGPPECFRTKREAVASFEAWMDARRRQLGELAYAVVS